MVGAHWPVVIGLLVFQHEQYAGLHKRSHMRASTCGAGTASGRLHAGLLCHVGHTWRPGRAAIILQVDDGLVPTLGADWPIMAQGRGAWREVGWAGELDKGAWLPLGTEAFHGSVAVAASFRACNLGSLGRGPQGPPAGDTRGWGAAETHTQCKWTFARQ